MQGKEAQLLPKQVFVRGRLKGKVFSKAGYVASAVMSQWIGFPDTAKSDNFFFGSEILSKQQNCFHVLITSCSVAVVVMNTYIVHSRAHDLLKTRGSCQRSPAVCPLMWRERNDPIFYPMKWVVS